MSVLIGLIISTGEAPQFLRFSTPTASIEMPKTIVDFLRHRCTKEAPLHELFQSGEMIEITQGPLKGFIGFSINLNLT